MQISCLLVTAAVSEHVVVSPQQYAVHQPNFDPGHSSMKPAGTAVLLSLCLLCQVCCSPC